MSEQISEPIRVQLPLSFFSRRMVQFMRKQTCTIAGSFVTHIAMKHLGLEPGFVPGDVDCFVSCSGADHSVAERIPFRIIREVPVSNYQFMVGSEEEMQCSRILYNTEFDDLQGMKLTGQFIMVDGDVSMEKKEFDQCVGDSMDWTVVSSTISFIGGNLWLVIRHANDLRERILRLQNDDLNTKKSRVEKWTGRNFRLLAPLPESVFICSDSPTTTDNKIDIRDERRRWYYGLTNTTIKVAAAATLECCENVTVECLRLDSVVEVYNSRVRIVGLGGNFLFSYSKFKLDLKGRCAWRVLEDPKPWLIHRHECPDKIAEYSLIPSEDLELYDHPDYPSLPPYQGKLHMYPEGITKGDFPITTIPKPRFLRNPVVLSDACLIKADGYLARCIPTLSEYWYSPAEFHKPDRLKKIIGGIFEREKCIHHYELRGRQLAEFKERIEAFEDTWEEDPADSAKLPECLVDVLTRDVAFTICLSILEQQIGMTPNSTSGRLVPLSAWLQPHVLAVL